MADESIIADLKSQGFDKLIQDLSLSAKGFTELDKSMAEAQKKLDTLDKSSQEFKDLTKEINAAAIASKAYAESSDSLKRELSDTNTEIGKLQRSLNALEKAGETNTQTYKDLVASQDALKKKSGELTNTVKDLNAEIKNSGSDTRNLDKAVRAISTVASGYQVAQGALALYGGENKKFEQTLLKLNAVMAITQGLQQIQEELSKRDSVFTQAAAKAKLLYAAAIGTSTGAMKAFKVALLSTGIGVLIVGVTTLIANFDDLTKSGGFLSKVLKGIGDVVSKSVQAYKDLSDAIGLTNFAAKKAAEDEKIRQDEALDDLLRAQKVKIAILKIQGKETAEFELQLLKDEKVRNRQKLLEYDGLTDDERKKILERQKVLSDEIEIQEAVIKQISIDASKSAAEELLKQKKKEQNDRLKALSDAIENTFKIRKTEREAEARHQAQLDELDRKERERLQSTADFRKLKSAEYIAELEAQDQREKAIREKSDDERKVKEEAFRTARAERENADRERRLQAEQEHAEKVAFILQTLSGVADSIGNLASQAIQIRTQNEIQALENKRDKGLITEKQFERESAKIKTEAAKKQRAADIAIATAKIPLIFLQALTSAPFPFGLILASIASGIALAEVAILAASPLPQFKDGGQVSKKLGLIKGASHSQGGVPIEVEGDEYVMPVEQTKENLPALEAMHKGTFHKLFVPVSTALQPDIFSNIPNPSNIALPIVNENNDYSSINKRLDKLASEMWWLSEYTKQGNKVRERGTEKIVKNLETQRKRYV